MRLDTLVVHDFGICVTSKCGPSCDHREPPPAEIDICRAWLREWATPRKTFNARRSSYGLKHEVEGESRKPGASYTNVDRQGRVWTCDRVYVSNGAFIAAALLEGYRARPIRESSPNAFFNMGIQREPASRRTHVVVDGPTEAFARGDRDTIAALCELSGSLTAAARILGVDIGTIDRAVMGRRLRAPTRARILGVLERLLGSRSVHVSNETVH